jgi:hypothetical protein
MGWQVIFMIRKQPFVWGVITTARPACNRPNVLPVMQEHPRSQLTGAPVSWGLIMVNASAATRKWESRNLRPRTVAGVIRRNQAVSNKHWAVSSLPLIAYGLLAIKKIEVVLWEYPEDSSLAG